MKLSRLQLLNKNNYYTYIKFSASETRQLLERIEREWKDAFPDRPFEYQFMDEAFDAQYDADERRISLFTIFTILSIAIALRVVRTLKLVLLAWAVASCVNSFLLSGT